jgi:hypothetical protein
LWKRRRIWFLYTERAAPPGTGGRRRPVKGKLFPFDAGNKDILPHRKSRLKKRPRVYFIFYGKKKEKGIKRGPERGSQKRFQRLFPPGAKFFGGNGRKTVFYAPPETLFAS